MYYMKMNVLKINIIVCLLIMIQDNVKIVHPIIN